MIKAAGGVGVVGGRDSRVFEGTIHIMVVVRAPKSRTASSPDEGSALAADTRDKLRMKSLERPESSPL